MKPKKIKSAKILYRTFEIEQSCIDKLRAQPAEGETESRVVSLSFSSEEPVERWFGTEILDHKRKSIRLDRLEAGGALLVGHNHDDLIGVTENVKIDTATKRGLADVRFGKSARADEIFNDVKDGIRRFVSVGYRIHKMIKEKVEDEHVTYRAIDWQPFEISLVSVPADMSVGVGRATDEADFNEIIIEGNDMNKNKRLADGSIVANSDPREGVETDEGLRGATLAPAVVATASSVDVVGIRSAELSRIRDIEASGKALNMNDAATKFINEGRGIDEWNAEVVAAMRGGKYVETPSGKDADLGLTQDETRKFSMINVINHLSNPTDKRMAEAAAFEMECSRAVADMTGKEAQGLFVPNEALRHDLARDTNVGTGSAGGDLVATELLSGSFIDALTNALVLNDAGIMVLSGLQGNIAIPKKTAKTSAYWVTEGNAPTESQATFGQVAMNPKTVGAYNDYTRKFLLQSSLAAEILIRNDLASTLASEIDRVGINGSGGGAEPSGILQVAGIGSVAGGANGGAPDWDDIVRLEELPANNNVAGQNPAYLTNTKVRSKLKRTEMFGGSNGVPVWERTATNPLNGYAAHVSNSVPSNLVKGSSGAICSAIIMGHFSDLVLGMWGAMDIMVDPYSNSTSGTVRVVALQDVDFAVRRAQSFAAMVDALTN